MLFVRYDLRKVRRIQVLFEATRRRPVSRRIVLKSTTGKLEALSKFLEEKNLTSTLRGKDLKIRCSQGRFQKENVKALFQI
jgi:hypothetical protein